MGSVWLEQVDTALLNFIPTIVKHFDEVGTLVTSPVIVRNPEGEYGITKFPSVSIFNYDQMFDRMRFNWEQVVVDVEAGTATLENPAIPYNLYYQIDFWAKYQTDINEMTRRWLANVEPRSVLTVTDSEGVERHCVMELVDFANADFVTDEARIFHRAYSYRIWVELDESLPIYKKVVTERIIRQVE